MPASKFPTLAPGEISLRIVVLRGQRVLLDADHARIYDVSTKRLNEQVKRKARRFPEDFLVSTFRRSSGVVLSFNPSEAS